MLGMLILNKGFNFSKRLLPLVHGNEKTMGNIYFIKRRIDKHIGKCYSVFLHYPLSKATQHNKCGLPRNVSRSCHAMGPFVVFLPPIRLFSHLNRWKVHHSSLASVRVSSSTFGRTPSICLDSTFTNRSTSTFIYQCISKYWEGLFFNETEWCSFKRSAEWN